MLSGNKRKWTYLITFYEDVCVCDVGGGGGGGPANLVLGCSVMSKGQNWTIGYGLLTYNTIQYNTKFIYIVGNTKQYNISYE